MAKLRIEGGHGIVPNTILNHASISLKEEGLYAYIQSKPNGRSFSAERIAKSHSDGIDSVKSGLVGLQKKGLLSRTKVRLRNGTWDREYCLHATFVIPTTVENPPMDNPPVEKPSEEKPPIKKTRDSKQEIVNNTKDILSKDNIYEQSSSEKDNDDFLPGPNENISTTPQPPSKKMDKEFGDPDVNLCLDMIKHYNEGVLNGAEGKQRLYASHLIKKFKTMPKVKEGSMTWQEALSNILLRISNNKYYKAKLGGPQDIYDNLGTLIQVAKDTVLPNEKIRKVQKYIPPAPEKPLTEEEKQQRREILTKTQNLIKKVPKAENE